jgi:hypothetical protein
VAVPAIESSNMAVDVMAMTSRLASKSRLRSTASASTPIQNPKST